MSIFISVASYCDPILPFSITQAYEKAAWPDELHFCVVDQSPVDAPHPIPSHIPVNQVTYLKIDSKQARGCSWARSVAMSMMGDQDWFFQIDSHMMFEQDWDKTLIEKANQLMHFSPNCVLSCYPASFLFIDGVATPQTSTQVIRAHVVSPGTDFNPYDPFLHFRAIELPSHVGAVEGFHISGGCLFAPADFVQKLPWDPGWYFNEEECGMAIRLFTHGWTIYHIHGNPILHLYTQPENKVVRPVHWAELAQEGKEAPLWQRLSARGKRRMNMLMSADSSGLGVYGLGTKRSLKDYADECGIDYLARKIEPRAYQGPWNLAS